MIAKTGSGFDVILVTGEPYADHPLSPAGVIARVLESAGYSVGVIEHPDWTRDDELSYLGRPRLFFGITSGSVDSMLVNYSPLKRAREKDPHAPAASRLPDRAVIVYANLIRRLHKGVPIVLGGIEASLRRFAHYDYWDDAVRRSILLDARADILVYGPGEKQVVEIAGRLERGEGLDGIPGTCIVRSSPPGGAVLLPPAEAAASDPDAFIAAQRAFGTRRLLAQPHANRFVVQYPAPETTPEDLDRIFALPFTREIPPGFPEFEMAGFSVVTHRGCVGDCSFCALALHQGDRVVSRSEASVLAEIERLTGHPEFKGYVDDLGGPTANMYGMDCAASCPDGRCLACRALDRSHGRLVRLLRRARAVPGVKKVFVRSGVRFDLALSSPEYVRELASHHVSGRLKIAPEHVSPGVLRLMNKASCGRGSLETFERLFREAGGSDRPQHLQCYFMVGHPGTSDTEARELAHAVRRMTAEGGRPVEGVQIFTPTPMTRSTCMYWTGRDPITGEEVHVPRSYAEKKAQKRMLVEAFGPPPSDRRRGSRRGPAAGRAPKLGRDDG